MVRPACSYMHAVQLRKSKTNYIAIWRDISGKIQ